MQDKKENLKKNAWLKMPEQDLPAVHEFNRDYRSFLNRVKTEREAVIYIKQAALEQGFMDMDKIASLEPGQKLFFQQRGKICALLVIGREPLENGVNLVVSHIDSPRLDLKANPLYEADGLALFKTHYYGGIKKYQWLAIPLALHGVVIKKDGKSVNVAIGEAEDDFVLTISDLLPHLAQKQMEKKMSEVITGEDLNLLVGSQPLGGEGDNPIKKQILAILQEKYDIEEEDFSSAELQAVPAFPAQDIGFDRSMIGSYGQDDRVCAYTSLRAALELQTPQRTAICLFVDKEEIGSNGNTGLQSLIIENLMAELMNKAGHNNYLALRRSLANSYALSADVNAGVDPNYPEVFEKMNCSFLGQGVVLTKYTGSRGKSGSNDANPEFLARIRRLFDDNGVFWQVGELGKVDIGGGGTVAHYMSRYGMEVVDLGVAILGMHSPFEVSSKIDVFLAYKAYRAFMQDFS